MSTEEGSPQTELQDWAVDVGINPLLSQPVSPGTTVTFLDGRRSDTLTGTLQSLGNSFHAVIAITSRPSRGEKGSTTTYNVPHMSGGRPIGWYLINPNELVQLVSATQFTVTY
jgi:hypothetical protein